MRRYRSFLAFGFPLLAVLVLTACPQPGSGDTVFVVGGTGGGGGTGTSPTVTITTTATATAPVAEGGQIDVKVTLATPAGADASIPFTVVGAAVAGTSNAAGNQCVAASDFTCDYTVVTASPLVIPAGTKVGHILIDVTDDPFEEKPDLESLTVTLGTPTNATLGATTAVTAFITDNDSDGLDNTVSGRVVSAADGSPVSGVTVSGGGQTTTTSATGHFSLSGPTPGAPMVVNFAKAGFVPQNKTTEQFIASDSATILNVHMVPNSTTSPFDPAVGGTFAVPPTGAQVTIAGGTLVKAVGGGAPDAGSGTISVTPILPGIDTGTLPGIYRTSNGPPAVGFESFGGLDILVQDVNGNVLELAPPATANARIPVSTRNASPPASAEVFGFSSTTGLWTSEGTNTLGGTAPAQYYDSTIAHLGSFSAAQASPTVLVTGCVVDPTGSPVPDATVVAEGIAYSGTTQVQTDSVGAFKVPVELGQQAFVTANKRTGVSNALTVNSSAATTLSSCLLLIPGAASVRLTWGASPSDLDSHLLGPNQSSHVYYASRGSFSALPFAALDVDDTTGFGPEITTIVKMAKSRAYSFWVRNYSQSFSPGMTGSPARVELYIKGEQTVFTPPLGEGSSTAWHVFDFTTDTSCDVSAVTLPAVPWSTQSDLSINDPANNPNADDLATFCN